MDDGSASVSVKGSLAKSSVMEKIVQQNTSFNNLCGDAMTEFRQSVKKVELPT
ncbi:hypothetical protein A2U01_0115032, partial [Trifolium medium]|nr:hypothetical protein [Trifolium medium]